MASIREQKRSLTILGHRTSISLEDAFWDALKEIAKADGLTLPALVARIDASRDGKGSLSSAIRVFVLERVRQKERLTMAEIINLKRVRKLKLKSAKEVEAAQNRVTHGRTKAEKNAAKAEQERHARLHEGKGWTMTAKKKGPLEGIVVVDLTRVLAGPFSTMMLADLGAEVIKVENPDGGDDSRTFLPMVSERSAYFMSVNRGKKSVALNLKDENDRRRFEALLARADVLVENFRGGTMEKLGYGWEELHPLYPKLIYAAVSGFGHTGPYAHKAAYDMVVQAMGGVMSITGHPGGKPTRVGVSIGDITAGLFLTSGITSALYHRAMTGESQKVDVAMLDCQVAILENAIAQYVATGHSPGPLGDRHGSIAPFGVFHASDGHLVIAAGNDALFAALARALHAPQLKDDPRFATNEARVTHVTQLTAELNHLLATHTKAEWIRRIDAAGVPCGPINNIADVMQDPQIRARNMIITTDDPVIGRIEMPGNPIKLSAFDDPSTRHDAPELDEDRKQVLGDLA